MAKVAPLTRAASTSACHTGQDRSTRNSWRTNTFRPARLGRRRPEHEHQRRQRQARDGPERRPPPEQLTQQRPAGHPGHTGQGHAGQKCRGSTCLPARTGHSGRRGHRDGEEPGVGDRGDDPGAEQHGEVTGEGTDHVRDDEGDEERRQRPPSRPPGTERGHHRRADDHADRVGGREARGGRHADGQVDGDRGHEPRQHELGRALRENGKAEDIDEQGQGNSQRRKWTEVISSRWLRSRERSGTPPVDWRLRSVRLRARHEGHPTSTQCRLSVTRYQVKP